LHLIIDKVLDFPCFQIVVGSASALPWLQRHLELLFAYRIKGGFAWTIIGFFSHAHSDCDERCSFLRDFIINFLLRDCIQPGRSLQNWDQQGRNPAKSISSTKDDLNLSHALVGDYFLDQVWLLGAFQTICGPRCPAVDFLEGAYLDSRLWCFHSSFVMPLSRA